jgi:hypothetical protein
MTRKKSVDPVAMPTTLRAAHELLTRSMPDLTAPLSEWLAFRRRSAAIYTHVADVDRGHHHEALYWVQREHEEAQALAQQMAAKTDRPERPEVSASSQETKEEQCPQTS